MTPGSQIPLRSTSPAGLAWLDRVLSLPLVFALLTVAAFVIAWNRGITLMYALLAVMVAAAALSLIGARVMLRPATLRLRLPREAAVGDVISVELALAGSAWPRTRRILQFASLYPFAPAQSLFLACASANYNTGQRVRCSRRGVFVLREATVRCAYPFGLATMQRTWPVEPVGITVFPRIYPVTQFALPANSTRSSADLERPAPTRGQELFREVRDYRSGDNPRHIHWRSSARHGRLIVKEFDAIATGVAWIVLDLDPERHAGDGEDNSFERAVEIAATLAMHCVRAGLRCGLAGGLRADGTHPLLIPPATGGAHLRTMLAALSSVAADCPASYESVLAALAARERPGAQWILFAHGEGRIALPATLRRGGPPLWLRFDTASFADLEQPRGPLKAPLRQFNGYVIERDTDLALLFR
jgi:uncharacterized protein (DUF58 family)